MKAASKSFIQGGTILNDSFTIKEDCTIRHCYYHIGKKPLVSASIEIREETLNIWNLATKEKERRKGYAKKFLELLLQYYPTTINVIVKKENIAAINLYKQFGFIESTEIFKSLFVVKQDKNKIFMKLQKTN